MDELHLQLTSIDVSAAQDAEYAALAAFNNQIQAERFPDDPPIPLAEYVSRWQNRPSFVDLAVSIVWDQHRSAIIARVSAWMARTGTNEHLALCFLDVLPEFRRRGIGRRLLAEASTVAQRSQRRLLQLDTYARTPSGEAFMQRIGATKGLETHINQLVVAGLDHGLLRHWQTRAAERAAEFSLGCWVGAYPEEHLDSIGHLFDAMNSAPRDQLDVEDEHLTPDHIRQFDQLMFATGTERWTMYVRDTTSGVLAGYTELLWRPSRPAIVEQGATGVLPAYRNRGLGRWLKAAMLAKLVQERPDVQFVRTGNADSNAPMLHINTELGFKPYLASCMWQVETAQIDRYLAEVTAP